MISFKKFCLLLVLVKMEDPLTKFKKKAHNKKKTKWIKIIPLIASILRLSKSLLCRICAISRSWNGMKFETCTQQLCDVYKQLFIECL